MKVWDDFCEKLEKVTAPDKLEKDLLDNLIGFQRATDSLVGFPKASDSLKTPDAKAKVIVKVVKSMVKTLKKMQLDKMTEAQQPQARRLVCYLFSLVQEGYNYVKKTLVANVDG